MDSAFNGVFQRARAELGVTSFGMQMMQLPHDSAYPYHDHAEEGQEEVYVILEGLAEFEIEGERHEVGHDTAIRVGPDTKRRIHPGPEGVRILALGGVPGGVYQAPSFTEVGAPDPVPPSE
jgi:mannose-6-phosphate isomerase-like protein (cupin superfamily)